MPHFRAGECWRTVHETAYLLRASSNTSSATNAEEEQPLFLSSAFEGKELLRTGHKILEALEKKAAPHGENNFRHFALDLYIGVLVPCLICRYLSRAGKVERRTAMVEELAPALFCPGKMNYYKVLLYYFRELECVPPPVREAMLQVDIATSNFSGMNSFGNIEQNEALEQVEVLSTTQNARCKSRESLKKSFYTWGKLGKAYNTLQSSVSTPKAEKEWLRSAYEKCLSKGAFKMFQFLCSSHDRTSWLRSEHCSLPVLTNFLLSPPLVVIAAQQKKLLTMMQAGWEAMDRVGVRFVPKFRSKSSQSEKKEASDKKKDALEFFNDRFKQREAQGSSTRKATVEKQKSASSILSMWRERSLETAKLAKVIASSAATPEEKGAALLRLDLFHQHPYLVSLYPDVFLNNTGDGPRPPHKSTFWTTLQDALGHRGTFIQLG
ncbi:unnamed protein product [Agarophyton chilense]